MFKLVWFVIKNRIRIEKALENVMDRRELSDDTYRVLGQMLLVMWGI